MTTSRAPQIGYLWHKPLWFCPDCAEGYEGNSDYDSDVIADMEKHNLINHGRRS